MRKITHLSKTAIKLLPACVLAVMAMPAHSAIDIDQLGGARNGLNFTFYNSLYPYIVNHSQKTTYTLGDPALYNVYNNGVLVTAGTMDQVFADQDRKDTDERNRLANMDVVRTSIGFSQALNKDWRASAEVNLRYTADGSRYNGIPWGIGLRYKSKAYFSLGNTYPGIGVGQTDADELLSNSGTYLTASYFGIPNLTVMGIHSLTNSGDTNDRTDFGWHKNDGLSVQYQFNPNPWHQVTLGVAGTRAKGHESPWYTNQPAKEKTYMGSIAYRYRDVTLGFDYGKAKEKFDGRWFDELDTTSYGVKATYRFTPRMQGSLSYSHLEAGNNKVVGFQHLLGREIGLNEDRYFFAKTTKDRYRMAASYRVRDNLSLLGSVENARIRHYVDGANGVLQEFVKRESLTATAGVSFSF